MRHFALVYLVCFLTLALPASAGDPGDDFWALVEIRKANWAIDDGVEKSTGALREGRSSASKARERWRGDLANALQLKARSLALHNGDWPEAAQAVSKMMRLQIQRLEGLIAAAQVEETQGLAAAKPLWAKQLQAYKSYKQQEAIVLDLMNWIEENP